MGSWVTEHTGFNHGEKQALAYGFIAADGSVVPATAGEQARWRVPFPRVAQAVAFYEMLDGMNPSVTYDGGTGPKRRVNVQWGNDITSWVYDGMNPSVVCPGPTGKWNSDAINKHQHRALVAGSAETGKFAVITSDSTPTTPGACTVLTIDTTVGNNGWRNIADLTSATPPTAGTTLKIFNEWSVLFDYSTPGLDDAVCHAQLHQVVPSTVSNDGRKRRFLTAVIECEGNYAAGMGVADARDFTDTDTVLAHDLTVTATGGSGPYTITVSGAPAGIQADAFVGMNASCTAGGSWVLPIVAVTVRSSGAITFTVDSPGGEGVCSVVSNVSIDRRDWLASLMALFEDLGWTDSTPGGYATPTGAAPSTPTDKSYIAGENDGYNNAVWVLHLEPGQSGKQFHEGTSTVTHNAFGNPHDPHTNPALSPYWGFSLYNRVPYR
jgi:hypothetical protein